MRCEQQCSLVGVWISDALIFFSLLGNYEMWNSFLAGVHISTSEICLADASVYDMMCILWINKREFQLNRRWLRDVHRQREFECRKYLSRWIKVDEKLCEFFSRRVVVFVVCAMSIWRTRKSLWCEHKKLFIFLETIKSLLVVFRFLDLVEISFSCLTIPCLPCLFARPYMVNFDFSWMKHKTCNESNGEEISMIMIFSHKQQHNQGDWNSFKFFSLLSGSKKSAQNGIDDNATHH